MILYGKNILNLNYMYRWLVTQETRINPSAPISREFIGDQGFRIIFPFREMLTLEQAQFENASLRDIYYLLSYCSANFYLVHQAGQNVIFVKSK